MYRKLKKRLSRYINCSFKGVISLFMAVLMTPFLSIAMVLVETGRYNSAVSILEEAMGVSSTSTLAHYDSYLHDRWGFMAVNQEIDVNDEYKKVLTENKDILGKSIDLNAVSAEGIYDLADSEVLYQQLMEYCKLNSPTTLAMNFLNISDLLSTLNKQCNYIGNIFNMVSGSVETVDSVATLVEALEKAKEVAKDLDALRGEYENKYWKFKTDVDALLTILKSPEPQLSDYKKEKEEESEEKSEEEESEEEESEEEESEEEEYDEEAYRKAVEERNRRIASAKRAIESSKKAYIKVITQVISKQEIFKEKMKGCTEAMASIQSNLANVAATAVKHGKDTSQYNKELKDLQDDIKNVEKSPQFDPQSTSYIEMKNKEQELSEIVAVNSMNSGLASATKDGLTVVSDGYKDTCGEYDEKTLGEYIKGFKELKKRVEEFNVEALTKNSTSLSDARYHNVAVAGYITESEIDRYLKEQEQELKTGSLKDLLDGFIAFMDSLMRIETFYNPDFSATVDTNYYNAEFGSLPGGNAAGGGAIAIINDIGSFLSSVRSFKNNLEKLKLLDALKSLKDILISVKNLLVDIIKFGRDMVINIRDLFSNTDRLFYSTYNTFNLPCRTDCSAGKVSFKTMTGYTLGGSSLPDNGTGTAGIFGNLQALISSIQAYANGSGTDLTFSGAELEYILYGSKSEISNQLYTFCVLYLIRLVLDAIPVSSNAEVQALATASTFGYPLVMAAELLLEPLVDTILLVNGENLDIYKRSVYLTPSGLPNLLDALLSFVKVTPDQEESLKSGLVNAFGAADDTYKEALADVRPKQTENKQSSGNKVWSDYKGSFLKLNYREYCFLIMLLTVTKEQQIARLQNLVQMETLYHYKSEGAAYTFDLRKSNTYLKTEADVKVKQMLPSLLEDSLFSIKREQYRGY